MTKPDKSFVVGSMVTHYPLRWWALVATGRRITRLVLSLKAQGVSVDESMSI